MSLLGADCPVDRSTGAEPSQKSDADHSILNCGVVLSGDGFRRSEAGDPAYIPFSCQRCIWALGRASLRSLKPVSCMLCAMEPAACVPHRLHNTVDVEVVSALLLRNYTRRRILHSLQFLQQSSIDAT